MYWLGGLGGKQGYANSGAANFTWPFAGYIERWDFLLHVLRENIWSTTARSALLAHVSLTVCMGWILFRPRWKELWWRIGALQVALLAVLNTQVWEGYPGAAARVLLPLTLAFNVLVPRGKRAWVWLVLGNLSFFSGLLEMRAPPQPVVAVSGSPEQVGGHGRKAQLEVVMASGFYAVEGGGSTSWQWTAGDAVCLLKNYSGKAMRVHLEMDVRALDERHMEVWIGERRLLEGALGREVRRLASESFELPPGETRLELRTSEGVRVAGDARALALRLFSFEVFVEP